MFHFIGNPTCSARTSDTEARVSSAPDLETFQDCQSTDPRYCAECANVRSDFDRYAELRALVEDLQRSAASPFAGTDEQIKRLLEWSHR